MSGYRPIDYKAMVDTLIFYPVAFPIIGIVIYSLPIYSPLPPLSESSRLTYIQSLFDSALLVSTILITIAPVTARIFEEDERDRPGLRKYLKFYMTVSVILLFVTIFLVSMCTAESWYDISGAGSLYLLFNEVVGYLLLCFPIRGH